MNIIKYFYNGITLYKYCFYYDLPYQSICSSIRYRIKKGGHFLNVEEIIKEVIPIYMGYKNKNIISKLRNEIIGINKVKSICKDLNLAYKNVIHLINSNDFDANKILILVYFKNDQLNYKGEKILTTKTKGKINDLINTFVNKKRPLNYNESLLLYWLGFDIAKDSFLEKISKEFVPSKAWKIIDEYKFNNNYFEDIKSDIFLYVFKMIDKLLPYNDGQIIKYINSALKSLIPFFITQYGRREVSFDTLKL